MTPLTPPDRARCQAEITTHNPWVMGGPVRQTTRCSNAPTVVIYEKKKGKDGRKGSMSLCDSCLAVARKQLGDTFREERILP